jgi:feruloyl-CoA synthase
MILRSPQKLAPYPRSVCDMLAHWAVETPGHVFLAERAGAGWRRVTFAEALAAARAIAQALLDRRLSAERPVAVLSDNGVDHALLALGAMLVGVPVAPVSVAYSLQSRDFGKLRQVLGALTPGLLFAANADAFAKALGAVDLAGAEVVACTGSPDATPFTPFGDLVATLPTGAVDEASRRVGPDTVAKILFSSGSTGTPKGIVNTQRMLCANQQAIAQVWPFLAERPPVIVDWLPWSHTFGGNHNFNMMLRHGGTLYVDDGKPTPERIGRTVANLREVSPTLYFNVPRGFDMLLPHLESDAALRESFFRELDLVFYAGAALPQNLWERMEAVSLAARGERVPLVSAWGSTETAPAVTSVHFPIDRAGVIGLPIPGCELKMVPSGGKLELRVRGRNVTPGYWRRDDLTREAFDEDGFYRIGDAGRLADPQDPARGVEFDGRIAEDFKLMSGTWVHVGALRVRAIAAAAPVVQDAVVTGHNREEVGLLLFASEAGCRRLCPDAPADASLPVLVRDPRVRGRVAAALAALGVEATGSSNRPTRAILMEEPPSIDAGEITDKGYVNQAAVLLRRAALVERLYAAPAHLDVIAP